MGYLGLGFKGAKDRPYSKSPVIQEDYVFVG